ncbi:MAG: hypothetical protein KBD31_05895 [Proteobacteria bacterium]|nr:hypothetical protein [Pseudomonadota bacterium]
MINNKLLVALIAATAFLNTGCAPKVGGSDYNMANVGEVSETFEGIIVSKRVVNISGNQTGVGAMGGAALGGLAGSNIGGGVRGHAAGAIGGALVGGLIGHAAEQGVSGQEGFEYSVKILKTGEIITLAQGAEPNLAQGQPCYVVRSNRGHSRVIPR